MKNREEWKSFNNDFFKLLNLKIDSSNIRSGIGKVQAYDMIDQEMLLIKRTKLSERVMGEVKTIKIDLDLNPYLVYQKICWDGKRKRYGDQKELDLELKNKLRWNDFITNPKKEDYIFKDRLFLPKHYLLERRED